MKKLILLSLVLVAVAPIIAQFNIPCRVDCVNYCQGWQNENNRNACIVGCSANC